MGLTTPQAADEPKKGGILFGEAGNPEDAEEDVFESEDAAIPVAPGQINASSRGAEPILRRGHFEAFNAQQAHRWKANINKKDGKVRVLYGNLSDPYTGRAEQVARGFLNDARLVFGMRENLDDLKTIKVDRSPKRHHVKFQQSYQGIPVRGALVLVHSNESGQVSMVQNDYLEDLQVDNRRVVSFEEAQETALEDLRAQIGAEALIADPRSEEIIVPHANGQIFVWKIAIPTEDPYGLWVYHIDAENGAIIYNANEITSLRKGRGRVYKNNGAWVKGKTVIRPLANMFTRAEGLAEGWLYGRHGDIYDDNGNDPFAPNYKFIYNPLLPEEKPWFDATMGYYQLNRIWFWWRNKVLRKYGPAAPAYFYSLSIPAIVNVNDLCDAFYTPELGEGIPGFVFGNENACSAMSEDLVVDKGVVSHEYAHAMMDWCGFDAQFGGEIDQYGRAMGEGNADWYGYLYTKSPYLGTVAWAWSEDGYLRRLNNGKIYPDDVDDPTLGVPEEHYTGQIWGGYLYDLSRVLKEKALRFVYQGYYYFTPEGGHRPDHPDFYDAMYAQILAEQDLHDGKSKNSAKAWGSMASRGLNAVLRPTYAHPSDYFGTGSPGGDEAAYYMWSFPQVKRIKTSGKFLNPGDTHEYPIHITEAGRNLRVLVKTRVITMSPQIELYTTAAELVASGTTLSAKKAALAMADMPPGEYVVVLNATLDPMVTSPNNGKYTIDVRVK
jgi:hypothetical protein